MNQKYSLIGNQILESFATADKFTLWEYSEIKPYIKGNILEIGSGKGTYSRFLVRDFKKNQIFLSDVDNIYLHQLKKKMSQFSHVKIVKLDLNDSADYQKIIDHFPCGKKGFDTVIAINVLEHIKDDLGALKNLYKLLKKNGRLIILVPAHKFLFNQTDSALGHFRRYNKKEISQKIAQFSFRIEKIFYFNFFAIFGWYINGNILNRKVIGKKSMAVFDWFVPLFKFIENNILRQVVGISLITILKKS